MKYITRAHPFDRSLPEEKANEVHHSSPPFRLNPTGEDERSPSLKANGLLGTRAAAPRSLSAIPLHMIGNPVPLVPPCPLTQKA